jgi:ribosomal protein S12 methylthiotransferase accessory factor
MLNQPCINPAYLVKTLEPDTVFFISERQSTTIQDPLYYRLVNAIDGECSVDQILDQLQLGLLQDRELAGEPPN